MVCRELYILKKLSQFDNNLFTTKLFDAFVNEEAIEDPGLLEEINLVFEFHESSLGILIDRKVPLDYDQLLTLCFNLLQNVSYIHEAGVMHRDIKPNNILVNSQCTVNICDFGWSRSVPQEKAESKKRTRPLTPNCQQRFYRAPEVLLLSQQYD